MLLAKDGAALGAIAHPADAGETVRFAAAELQRYLALLSGAHLPLSEGAGEGARIRIEADPSLEDEEYEITADGDSVRIRGGLRAGPLYGAYDFLKEAFGVVFAGHSADGEHLPRLPDLEVGPMALRRRPLLWYRGSQLTVWGEIHGAEVDSWREQALRRIDWMAKNGMNFVLYQPWEATDAIELQDYEWTGEGAVRHMVRTVPHWYTNRWFRENLLPEIRKRGMRVEQSHHNLRYYLPPSDHFAAHPEYYALVGGKRDPGLSQLMICTSNDEAVDALVAGLVRFVEENPEVDVVGLMPEDGLGVCECEACARLDEPRFALRKDGYRYFFGQNQNKTRRYVRVVNRAARALRERFPEKLVSALFYVDMAWPPEEMALEPNVMPMVCMYVRCGAHAYDDPSCAVNRDFFDMIRAWSAFGNRHVVLYEYYMGISYLRSMPWPISRRIAADWPLLASKGIGGASMQYSVTANETHGRNGYAFARRAWDLAVPYERILDDYERGMFGSVGPVLRRIHERFTERFAQAGREGRDLRPYPQTLFDTLPAEDVAWADAVCAEALAAAATERERLQVERFRRTLEHMRRFRDIDDRMKAWGTEERERMFPGLSKPERDALPKCDRETYGRILALLDFERTYKDEGYFAIGNDTSQWMNAVRNPRAE